MFAVVVNLSVVFKYKRKYVQFQLFFFVTREIFYKACNSIAIHDQHVLVMEKVINNLLVKHFF